MLHETENVQWMSPLYVSYFKLTFVTSRHLSPVTRYPLPVTSSYKKNRKKTCILFKWTVYLKCKQQQQEVICMSHLVSSEVNQMSFPSVQPLRYWKSRPVEAVIVREHNKRL